MDEAGLGEQLQLARKAAGLTQQELCHRAKLSYSTLAKIERGAIKSPSIFTIQNIAAALDMDLNQLMGDSSVIKKHKKKSLSGIEFVYFDINGCLVRFFQRAFTELALDTGASVDLIERTFWHYNDRVCSGDMAMEEFNREMADKLKIPDLDWRSYYLQAIDPISELVELLTLISKEYRVGLFSNIMPGFIKGMIENGTLPSLDYEVVIDSSEVKMIKPNPEIYKLAADRSGVSSDSILLIDDTRANIIQAEQNGWHVIWVDQYHPEESAIRIKAMLQ